VNWRWLSAFPILVLVGCSPLLDSSETTPQASPTVGIDEVCGNPTWFPVSQECVGRMGYPYGTLLKQKSDLLMAVWRSCPSASPCEAVQQATPACLQIRQGRISDETTKACHKAQRADHSCGSLLNDPMYKQRDQAEERAIGECLTQIEADPACAYPANANLRSKKSLAAWNRADACLDRCLSYQTTDDNPECNQARAKFADFQDRVQKAALDAELKQAFDPPRPIAIPYQPAPQPVFIQPAVPRNTTCMPFGMGVNCHSW
jgi:hypothetical protein